MGALDRNMNPWVLTEDHKQCPDCAWLPKGWVNECETCDGSGLVHYSYIPETPLIGEEDDE